MRKWLVLVVLAVLTGCAPLPNPFVGSWMYPDSSDTIILTFYADLTMVETHEGSGAPVDYPGTYDYTRDTLTISYDSGFQDFQANYEIVYSGTALLLTSLDGWTARTFYLQ